MFDYNFPTMFISIESACQLTGRSKNALYRLMSQGRINYVSCTKGKRFVEVAELRRVYGELNGKPQEPNPYAQTFAPSDGNQELFTLINLLRNEISALSEKVDKQSQQIEALQANGVSVAPGPVAEAENSIVTVADSPEKDPEWPPYITCYADLAKRDEIKAKYAFMAKYGK